MGNHLTQQIVDYRRWQNEVMDRTSGPFSAYDECVDQTVFFNSIEEARKWADDNSLDYTLTFSGPEGDVTKTVYEPIILAVEIGTYDRDDSAEYIFGPLYDVDPDLCQTLLDDYDWYDHDAEARSMYQAWAL